MFFIFFISHIVCSFENRSQRELKQIWDNWKTCSGVLCDSCAGEAEGEGVQNRVQTSDALWGGDPANNEETGSKATSEWDEDAEVNGG